MFGESPIARTRVEVSMEEVGMVQRTWARQKEKSTELGVENKEK